MFAILISEDNMPTIAESGVLQARDISSINIYLRPGDWYLIRGYVSPRGNFRDWTVLPAYSLEDNFDYDPDKIKTDFVNLVRKEAP